LKYRGKDLLAMGVLVYSMQNLCQTICQVPEKLESSMCDMTLV